MFRKASEIQIKASEALTKSTSDSIVSIREAIINGFRSAIDVIKSSAIPRRTGGFIPGPFKGVDKTMVAATPGEFVVRKDMASMHADLLEEINAGKFRRGGSISERMARAAKKRAFLLRRRQLRRLSLTKSLGGPTAFEMADGSVRDIRFIRPEDIGTPDIVSKPNVDSKFIGSSLSARRARAERRRKQIIERRKLKRSFIPKPKDTSIGDIYRYTFPKFNFGGEVPIFATPGEFVVNKMASQKNLTLLKAINSGKLPKFENGGLVPAHRPLSEATVSRPKYSKQFAQSVLRSSSNTPGVSSNEDMLKAIGKIDSFVQQLSKTSQAFSEINIPTSIDMKVSHTVEVIINGAEVLTKLEPSIMEMAISQVNSKIKQMFTSTGEFRGESQTLNIFNE